MCLCDPNLRTPWCGKDGCEMPERIYPPDYCKRCGAVHPLGWDCKFDTPYQYWLLEELRRVNFAINSRLK